VCRGVGYKLGAWHDVGTWSCRCGRARPSRCRRARWAQCVTRRSGTRRSLRARRGSVLSARLGCSRTSRPLAARARHGDATARPYGSVPRVFVGAARGRPA
jgi:hypothetical protein